MPQQFYYPNKKIEAKLAGQILIVPIVSTANVSQLAVDLLIASLSLRRIGLFDPRDLVPVVGARDDGEEGVTTPFELFGRIGLPICVIQQRSPALKDRKQQFIDALLNFIKTSKFTAVLFLSGVNLSERTDAQMITPTYHIHPQTETGASWESSPLASIKQLQIPEYTSPVQQHPFKQGNEGPIPFIPGGGLTRRILSSIPPSFPIPVAALLQFAMEGDNRADASLLAAVAAKVLGLDSVIKEWMQPDSWNAGLFGTPPDQTLYG